VSVDQRIFNVLRHEDDLGRPTVLITLSEMNFLITSLVFKISYEAVFIYLQTDNDHGP